MSDRDERVAQLEAYHQEHVVSCVRCALSEGRTQVVVGNGDPDAGGDVRGRGPRLPRGRARPAVRGPGGQAARLAAGGHRDVPRRRLRRQRPQVPASGQPGSAARGDPLLRAAPLPSDRAHPAHPGVHAGELRHEAPLRAPGRHLTGARPRAAAADRRPSGAAVPALPPGRGALHAGDAEHPPGGLRPDPGAPGRRAAPRAARGPGRPRGRRGARRRPRPGAARPEPADEQLGLF